MSRQAAFSSHDQRYQETLDWIYSWIDFSMKRHVDDKHRFFKLDRMNRLMELLDHPPKGITPACMWPAPKAKARPLR